MQTFVPCVTYAECASVLDRQRLGKQRVESLQILTSLHALQSGYKYGWSHHPAGNALTLVRHRLLTLGPVHVE